MPGNDSGNGETGPAGPEPAAGAGSPASSSASIRDFEAAIGELESIVKKLEEGDLPLEQSLALYERGVQLSRFCHARLEEAERRIELLTDRGELKPAPASLSADSNAGGRDRS